MFLCILFFLTCVSGQGAPLSWFSFQSFSEPRMLCTAVTVNSSIVVVGGRNVNGDTINTTEIFDTVTREWTIQQPMPAPIFGSSFAITADYISLFAFGAGGDDADHSNSVFKFSPDGTWSSVTSGKPPTQSRVHVSVSALGGVIYLLGGANANTYTPIDLVESYTEGQGFTAVQTTGSGWSRFDAAACVAQDFILLVGGSLGYAQPRQWVTDVWSFSPSTNYIRAYNSRLPTPGPYPACAVVGNKAWIFSQTFAYPSPVLYFIELYLEQSHEVSSSSGLSPLRFGGGLASVGSSIYLMGGADNTTGKAVSDCQGLKVDYIPSANGLQQQYEVGLILISFTLQYSKPRPNGVDRIKFSSSMECLDIVAGVGPTPFTSFSVDFNATEPSETTYVCYNGGVCPTTPEVVPCEVENGYPGELGCTIKGCCWDMSSTGTCIQPVNESAQQPGYWVAVDGQIAPFKIIPVPTPAPPTPVPRTPAPKGEAEDVRKELQETRNEARTRERKYDIDRKHTVDKLKSTRQTD